MLQRREKEKKKINSVVNVSNWVCPCRPPQLAWKMAISLIINNKVALVSANTNALCQCVYPCGSLYSVWMEVGGLLSSLFTLRSLLDLWTEMDGYIVQGRSKEIII